MSQSVLPALLINFFRYYELKEKDCLKFAFSSREYVLLHDKTDTSHYDESSNESSDSD